MTKYGSGRKKVNPFSGLSTNRHLYLGLEEAEPNLGYPGEKNVSIANTYYRLVTIENGTQYDRYWLADTPAELVNGISVFDEGYLVGTANSVSKIDFRGNAVVAISSGSISTVTVYAPGYEGNILYNNSGDIDATSFIQYDTILQRVGIGSTTPTQTLDISGSIKIDSKMYDNNNISGDPGYVLTSTGIGISWSP